MHITDPIADMLTRIRNANSAKHDTVDIPASNMKKAIAQILVDEGYIKNYKIIEDGKQGVIRVTLKYGEGKSQVITGLRRVSKPGLRIYSNVEEMPKVMKGLGVDVNVNGTTVTVKGPNGTLSMDAHPNMTVSIEGSEIIVSRPNDAKENRSLHGLTRTLIHNMIVGVTEGFKKNLEVNGVGYRVQMQGNNLVMNLGFSHQVTMEAPEGIKVECPSANAIVISGADKQMVGQFAAQVREKRPPEPYKGKGIKYAEEHIRRKEGKAGKK